MGTRKQSRRGNTLEKPFLNISELKTDLSLQTGEVPLLVPSPNEGEKLKLKF